MSGDRSDTWGEAEPEMPLPPPEDERDRPILDVPVCSICGRMVRREMDQEYQSAFKCDLHGEVQVRWEKV